MNNVCVLGPGYNGYQIRVPAMLLPVNSNMMDLPFNKEKTLPNYIIAYHGGKKPENPEQGAEQMAKACPFLDTGGTLEVAEMVEM